jgi:subtilisin family serine protease
MSEQVFTAAGRAAVREVEPEEVVTVIVRTNGVKSLSDKPAQRSFDTLRTEQLATRRAELLADVHKRYGDGKTFCENYMNSRLEAQEAVVEAAPVATNLWLADAIAVSGTKAEIEDLARHPDVVSIDVNPRFRLPEILQTPLEDTPQSVDGSAWGVARIGAPEVWGGFGRGEHILVGVLDTGTDDTHPALAGKVAAFEEFDSMGLPLGTPVHDSDVHGTHVAGTICGRTYRGTNIGVAPEAKVASALVLPGGQGTFAQIIAGMQWAVVQGVHVINMSLGGSGYTTLWNLPVLNATLSGVLVVASIGNSGHGTSGGPGNDLYAIGVGATQYVDTVAGFSSGQSLVGVWHDVLSPIFGPITYMKPEISAPGVSIISSVPGPDLAAFNGTSMAAPHVAGATALLLSTEPALQGNPFAVREILLGAGREDLGEAGRDQRFGFGRLDAMSAAEAAVSLF